MKPTLVLTNSSRTSESHTIKQNNSLSSCVMVSNEIGGTMTMHRNPTHSNGHPSTMKEEKEAYGG